MSAKSKRNYKPDFLRMKLRSRKKIAAWLLDAMSHCKDRAKDGGYEEFLFCADCDESSTDFSFNNLLAVYHEQYDGGPAAKDETWLKHCRQYYAEVFGDWDPNSDDAEMEFDEFDFEEAHSPERFYDWSNEDMQSLFGTNTVRGKPEDDYWNTTWNGDNVDVTFQYIDSGRSYNNTLALTEFEDINCTMERLGEILRIDAEGLKPHYRKYGFQPGGGPQMEMWIGRDYDPDEISSMKWKDLKHLYEVIQSFRHFFKRDESGKNGYVREMEYKAAWSLFVNMIEPEEFPNPTEFAMGKERREQQRKAFIAKMTGSSGRLISRMTRSGLSVLSTSPRKIIRGIRAAKGADCAKV